MRGNTDEKWVVLLKLPKGTYQEKNCFSDQAISFDRVFIYFAISMAALFLVNKATGNIIASFSLPMKWTGQS